MSFEDIIQLSHTLLYTEDGSISLSVVFGNFVVCLFLFQPVKKLQKNYIILIYLWFQQKHTKPVYARDLWLCVITNHNIATLGGTV